jgi:hypothetical protein
MMKLSQVFEQLTVGELSQVKLGGAEEGEIQESKYRAVASHVQLGLTTLYTRFNLKQGRLTLQIMPDMDTYALNSKYAVNGKATTAPLRWIIDTPAVPFKDDLLKIITVRADDGTRLPLNDYLDGDSVFTPTMDSLRLPSHLASGTFLKVEYQANHPSILPKAPYLDPRVVNIELPMSHLQALLYFVASRVHNPIGMGQEFNAGNNWAQRFESECQRLEQEGIEIDDSAQVNRAKRGGWV